MVKVTCIELPNIRIIMSVIQINIRFLITKWKKEHIKFAMAWHTSALAKTIWKTAFVISLKAEVGVLDAAKSAIKDWWIWNKSECQNLKWENNWNIASQMHVLTWINSALMKESSPTIAPGTCASATPKAPLMELIPREVPSPPFPDVAKSSYRLKI